MDCSRVTTAPGLYRVHVRVPIIYVGICISRARKRLKTDFLTHFPVFRPMPLIHYYTACELTMCKISTKSVFQTLPTPFASDKIFARILHTIFMIFSRKNYIILFCF